MGKNKKKAATGHKRGLGGGTPRIINKLSSDGSHRNRDPNEQTGRKKEKKKKRMEKELAPSAHRKLEFKIIKSRAEGGG